MILVLVRISNPTTLQEFSYISVLSNLFKSLEGIAKLHSEPNLRFFRWVRFFAKCLWPIGYVTLQKIEPTKKSLNFAREASFAIPSLKNSANQDVYCSE